MKSFYTVTFIHKPTGIISVRQQFCRCGSTAIRRTVSQLIDEFGWNENDLSFLDCELMGVV